VNRGREIANHGRINATASAAIMPLVSDD